MEITIDNWQARMSQDMDLRDYRPKTRDPHMRVARQFMERVGKPPTELTEEDVREYLDAARCLLRRTALVTLYGLGLRLGEVLRLDRSH